jgi:hypothetical protein
MQDISWLASQEGFSMVLVDTLQETTHLNRACFANAGSLSTVVSEHELFESEWQKKKTQNKTTSHGRINSVSFTCINGRQDGVVNVVTRLRAGRS